MAPLDDVDTTLNAMADLARADEFDDWRRGFVAKHVDAFDYGEENKLEYTAIHEQYCEGIEATLAKALPAGVGLEDFCERLKAHIEGGGGNAAGDAIQLLLEAADFRAFREMMLFEKSKQEMTGDAAAASILAPTRGDKVPQIDELMSLCAQLSVAAQEDAEWQNVLANDWMRLDKKPVEPERRSSDAEIYLRGVWTMRLSFVEACDMLLSQDERRSLWDVNCKSFTPVRGRAGDDDYVATAEIDYGWLLHMAGVPRTFTTRGTLRWDTPRRGALTYALVPWDTTKDAYDPNSILQIKTGTVEPHPTDPQQCIMSTLETNRLGKLPKFVLSGLLSHTAPQLMRGLEQRYIKNVREAGKTKQLSRSGS